MGEYAKYLGQEVKIGTCENMYYLRADQAGQVEAVRGSVDPVADRDALRFRFPFPDEDEGEPGSFDDYNRAAKIPGWTLPEGFDHVSGSVQFKAEPGYLLSLPCPEGGNLPEGIRVGKNGWSGGYGVRAQRFIEGAWWTIVSCGSCGEMWRLPREVAATVAEAFIAEAERTEYRRGYDFDAEAFTDAYSWEPANGPDRVAFLLTMARRVLGGYAVTVEV